MIPKALPSRVPRVEIYIWSTIIAGWIQQYFMHINKIHSIMSPPTWISHGKGPIECSPVVAGKTYSKIFGCSTKVINC
jgi:hypothetical protein